LPKFIFFITVPFLLVFYTANLAAPIKMPRLVKTLSQ
jgi:hypothetical protein